MGKWPAWRGAHAWSYTSRVKPVDNSYFLHWNFRGKSCFMVFFLKWKIHNSTFPVNIFRLSLEHNFFKWDGKVTKIWHLVFFHRIWKNQFCQRTLHTWSWKFFSEGESSKNFLREMWGDPNVRSTIRGRNVYNYGRGYD